MPSRALYRFFLYAIGIGALIGLFQFIYFMVTGINQQFGYGFGAGAAFTAAMLYLGWRTEESNRDG